MKSCISKVQDKGMMVVLTDGSRWAVDSFDAFHTQMWRPNDEVEASISP